MSRHGEQVRERFRVHVWLDEVDRATSDRLQIAARANGSSSEQHENASNVPLPESGPSSVGSNRMSESCANNATVQNPALPSGPQYVHTRSTSTGSLQQLQRADVPLEYRVPLPKSIPTSDEQSVSIVVRQGRRSSAHNTEQDTTQPYSPIETPNGNRSNNTDSSRFPGRGRVSQQHNLDASGINEPDASSPGAATGLNTASHIHFESQPPRLNYWQNMAALMDYLPHLKSIGPENGRHKTAGVLLIEDVSAGLIESLGSVFEIDPESFAEHLNRSGYDGLDYEDEPSTRWETHGMPKAHTSLKWYRPVQENPKITQWMKDPRSLLDPVYDNAPRGSNNVETFEFLDFPRLQRASTTRMWNEASNMTMQTRRSARTNRYWNNDTGLSERRKIPGSITWSDSIYRVDGQRNMHAMLHQAVVSTNIFRRSLPLSTRPTGTTETTESLTGWRSKFGARKGKKVVARAAHVVRKSSEDAWESGAVPKAWEEKASFFKYDKSRVPISMQIPEFGASAYVERR
nr:hypothetical protein CFP56_26073 [Quercus suber]